MTNPVAVPSYLNPEVISRLSRLDLIAKLVVEGFITGRHRSPYHGFSVEFAEHRPYLPGDALRDLDWKAYAKSDRLYVKRYEEETNLKSCIVLDISASMAFRAGGPMSKFRYGSCLSAALAHLMLRQRDAVGLMLFHRHIESYIPPRSVQSHLEVILRQLMQTRPAKNTHIASTLHELADRISRRGLVIVLSDLLDDVGEVLRGLRHFRYLGHEVVVFHLLDPRERDLNFRQETRFIDLENEQQEVTTQPLHVQREYFQQMADMINTYRRKCAEARIDYVQLDTTTPFDLALSSYLTQRRKLI